MEIVESLIKFLHIVVSIILIIAVLLQPGKSGDLGSMFGGGTSESVFGSAGAVPFLAKLTRILGVVFFATSLSLGYFAISDNSSSVLKGENAPVGDFDLTEDADTGVFGTLEITDNPTTEITDNPTILEEAPKPVEPDKTGEDSAEKQPEKTN